MTEAQPTTGSSLSPESSPNSSRPSIPTRDAVTDPRGNPIVQHGRLSARLREPQSTSGPAFRTGGRSGRQFNHLGRISPPGRERNQDTLRLSSIERGCCGGIAESAARRRWLPKTVESRVPFGGKSIIISPGISHQELRSGRWLFFQAIQEAGNAPVRPVSHAQ